MNYPHRGGHCRNRSFDNNNFRPETGSTSVYKIVMIQHVGKNITKPSALKFFGYNFSFELFVKKSHPILWMAFEKNNHLFFLNLSSRFDMKFFISFFVIKGDMCTFFNVVVDNIFGQ